jgi:hypothetical protein
MSEDTELKALAIHVKEAAYGFSPLAALALLNDMMENSDFKSAAVCVASVGQIRENVLEARTLVRTMVATYPILIIRRESKSGPVDNLNLTAVRYIGYWICHYSSTAVARALIDKGGSPLTGVPAAKVNAVATINKELVSATGTFRVEPNANLSKFCDEVFTILEAASAQ